MLWASIFGKPPCHPPPHRSPPPFTVILKLKNRISTLRVSELTALKAVLGTRIRNLIRIRRIRLFYGLPDPDPDPDPLVRVRIRIRLWILLFSHKYVERTEIMAAKYRNNLTQNFSKTNFFRLKMMCLWASYEKKIFIFLQL